MSSSARPTPDPLLEIVRNRILGGEVGPGGAIRQDAWAAELGVSKIPLREALARLEQEGLVEAQPNRGFFVRPLTTEEAEEVYALRLGLEPAAVALAAERANEAEQAEAHAALGALERVTSAHAAAVGSANRAFHLALIRPSGRALTTSFLERLHVLSERYVRKHLEPLGRDERANDEHRRLLAAWTDRDGVTAAHLTRRHIRRTIDDLRRQIGAND